MSIIEGYRFSIELDDRGMGRSLQTLAKEATTLKRVMQANFREAESLGNGYGALSGKLTGINQTIQAYQNAIKGAQRDMKDLTDGVAKARTDYEEYKKSIGDVTKASDEEKSKLKEKQKLYEDENKHLLSLIGKQENYRNQISRLRAQYTETNRQLRNYTNSLTLTRAAMSGVSGSLSEYNRLLDQQGMKAYTTRGKVQSLLSAQKLAKSQYSQEVAEAKRLQSSLSSLQSQYRKNASELAKNKREQEGLTTSINKLSNAQRTNKKSVSDLTNRYQSLQKRNDELKSSQNDLYSKIYKTTNDLQKQTTATTKASAQMLKFCSAVNSVGTGRFGALARSIGNVDAKLRASTTHTRAWANSLRGSLMTVGIGIGAFGAGIGKAVSMSANLQQSWVTTRNLLQTGAKNVAEARREVGRLGVMQRDAASYSKQYGYSQKEIADQYTELTKRGYTANQSIGSMKSMLQAARASGDDFNDVVKNVSSTVDAFGMRTNNTSKMIERTRRVTNAMAYAADMTATDFQGMGEAMSYVSASAHQAGQSVETTTAAVGELSNAGIEGTRAGTGMRKVMNSLIAPTSNATAALKKYGMSIDDFKNKDGSLKQLPDIMKIIESHTKNLGKADRGAFFKAVFGTTGQQAAMVLAQNADAMDKLVKKEKEAERSNYVERLAKKNMASTKMQMKQLQMQVQAFAIQVGNTLLPAVNKVGQAISKWAESSKGKATLKQFSDSIKGVGNTIARNAGSIISFLGGFATGLLDVAKGVNILITPLKWLFSGIAKLTGHSGDVSRFFGIVTGGIAGVLAVLKILHTAISGINAVRQDLKGLGVMKDTTAQLQEQDALYQRMIELQEESLALSKRQAEQQGINTESLGKTEGASETENIVSKVSTEEKEHGKAGTITATTAAATTEMEAAGEKAGSRYLTGFLVRTKGISRGILGLFLPTDFLNAGSSIGRVFMKGFIRGGRAVRGVIVESWRNFFKPILGIGPIIGKSLITSVANGMKRIGASTFGKVAKSLALEFGRSLKGTAVSIGQFLKVDIIPETWVKAGSKAASLFKSGFSRIRLNPKNWFKSVEPAAKDVGRASGGKLVEGISATAKGGKLAGIGKAIAKGIADPLMLALGAIDVMRAWNTSSHKERAKNVGGALGNVAGMAAGAKAGGALGASLGSVAPGIGNVVGGIIGTVIGGIAGTKIGKTLGPSLAKFWKGTSKTAALLFTGHFGKAMSNIGKSWKQMWSGLADWWDKLIGKKTKKSPSKSSSSSSSSSSKTFKSSSNVKYSKSDIQNLKAMTKAIGSYKSALKGLKSYVKNNDPSKQMNSMVDKMSASVKKWDRLASPIKKIGSAFKNLASFAKSMVKKDVFKEFTDDLKGMNGALKKYGKSIGDKVNSLGSKLKNNKLEKPLKALNKQLKDSTKTWKSFATPVKSLAKSFNTLQKATKTLSGKQGLESTKKGFQDLDTILKKQKIGTNLRKLAGDLNKSKVVKDLTSMNNSVKTSAKNWKSLATPITKVSKAFDTLAKSVKALNGNAGGKKSKGTGLTAVNDNIKTLYNTIKKYPFGKAISRQAEIANNAMSGKKTGFVRQFVNETNQMTKAVRSFGRAFNRDWKSSWRGLDSPVSRALRSVDSTVRSRLDDIQSRRESFSNSFLKGWNSWIDDVKSSFKSGFNKLPGYAASSMKDIISRLNKGITGVNKVIGDFGGDKKLSAISYATGTKGGHPGGHMLINDSSRPHYKELVKFPGQAWRMFEGRNVLIPNAPKGTEVINGEQTYALNSRGLLPRLGIHAYADGTDDGDEIADKIVKHPFEELKKIFFGATSFNGSPIVQDLGTAMSLGLIKGVQDIIKKMAEEADDNGKAATPAMIRKAAARMGIHDLTDSFVKLLMGVIMTESGNRSIRQSAGVQDVNARSGDWAAGILQYTNQTFMTYAMPGHTNRYKPYDELLAFFNNSDWRNSIGYPGYAHGKPDWLHSGPQGSPRMKHFANGGLVRQQMIATIGENNIPEMIIPLDINKRPRALNLIDSTLDHMEHDGGGTGGLHSRNNNSSEETNSYLKQAVVILGQIAGLNAQQIKAIANLNTGTDMKSRRARRSFYTDYGNDQRIADYQAF